ncbi:hypothetical protein D9M71_838160 [compost metagenome]
MPNSRAFQIRQKHPVIGKKMQIESYFETSTTDFLSRHIEKLIALCNKLKCRLTGRLSEQFATNNRSVSRVIDLHNPGGTEAP